MLPDDAVTFFKFVAVLKSILNFERFSTKAHRDIFFEAMTILKFAVPQCTLSLFTATI